MARTCRDLIQGEKISQGSIAEAANTSIVTLRKRLLDIRKVQLDSTIFLAEI